MILPYAYDYSLAGSGPENFEFRFRSSSDESAYYTFIYSKGGAWEFISPGRLIESGRFKPVSGSEDTQQVIGLIGQRYR
jgi:hypothetical protein